ncbi:MAG: hypothetical protein IIB99_12655 [Planctomycetes bacterium]|nr:hypothetical protein [Planctomycetota bacterium]
MMLRDEDANPDGIGTWSAASDGTLEERVYYCQNWHRDVSVLIEDDAEMVEWVKYSSYGVSFGLPAGQRIWRPWSARANSLASCVSAGGENSTHGWAASVSAI